MPGNVKKEPKAVKRKLARGLITPDEFAGLMKLAASGAKSIFLYAAWKDGHHTSVSEISDLEPIDDPAGIDYASGTFRFDDGSILTITLSGSSNHTATAQGEQAREKLDAISQYWAQLPGRGKLGFRLVLWLLCMSGWPALNNLLFLIIGAFDRHNRGSASWWALEIALVVIPACIFVFLLQTESVRGFRSLIVLARHDRLRGDVWKVAGVIISFASLCVALIAYFNPHH